jgi:hypothetical protein
LRREIFAPLAYLQGPVAKHPAPASIDDYSALPRKRALCAGAHNASSRIIELLQENERQAGEKQQCVDGAGENVSSAAVKYHGA